jgi:hypothetical protein
MDMEVVLVLGGLLFVAVIALVVFFVRAKREADECNVEAGRLRLRVNTLETENRVLKNNIARRERADAVDAGIDVAATVVKGCSGAIVLFVAGVAGVAYAGFQFLT